MIKRLLNDRLNSFTDNPKPKGVSVDDIKIIGKIPVIFEFDSPKKSPNHPIESYRLKIGETDPGLNKIDKVSIKPKETSGGSVEIKTRGG